MGTRQTVMETMTRYFFHSRDGDQILQDDVGVELPTDQAAVAEAKRALSELVGETLPSENKASLRIEVTDEGGASVAEASVDFALRILR